MHGVSQSLSLARMFRWIMGLACPQGLDSAAELLGPRNAAGRKETRYSL